VISFFQFVVSLSNLHSWNDNGTIFSRLTFTAENVNLAMFCFMFALAKVRGLVQTDLDGIDIAHHTTRLQT